MTRTEDRTPHDIIPEKVRRPLAFIFQWGGWLGSMGLGIWSIVEYDPTKGEITPPWVGLTFIFLLGIAIAGTGARSRMRLTDAIVHAFRTGQLVARNGGREEQSEFNKNWNQGK